MATIGGVVGIVPIILIVYVPASVLEELYHETVIGDGDKVKVIKFVD